MVNFGLLPAENISLVWGTPANFNGFRVLAALLHGTLLVGASQTAAFNRGRHLYSTGRPSRWALAHISIFIPRLISAATDWMSPYFYTWRGPSANLECRSEMCCTQLAANAGPKKVAINRHLGTIPQLCLATSSQLRHVSIIGKKLVKQQYLPYISPQYGELRPTSG